MLTEDAIKQIAIGIKPRLLGGGVRKKAVRKGGVKPSEDKFYKAAKKSYDPVAPANLDQYDRVMDTPTMDAYKYGNTILVGVRGTDFKDKTDLKADASIAINNLKNSNRYVKDKKDFQALVQRFPPASHEYYLAGHSLSGAVNQQLKRDFPFIKEGVSYNPAFQPSDLAQQDPSFKRYYTNTDFLYNLGGKFFRNVNMVAPDKPKGLKGWLTPKGVSGHYITNFAKLYQGNQMRGSGNIPAKARRAASAPRRAMRQLGRDIAELDLFSDIDRFVVQLRRGTISGDFEITEFNRVTPEYIESQVKHFDETVIELMRRFPEHSARYIDILTELQEDLEPLVRPYGMSFKPPPPPPAEGEAPPIPPVLYVSQPSGEMALGVQEGFPLVGLPQPAPLPVPPAVNPYAAPEVYVAGTDAGEVTVPAPEPRGKGKRMSRPAKVAPEDSYEEGRRRERREQREEEENRIRQLILIRDEIRAREAREAEEAAREAQREARRREVARTRGTLRGRDYPTEYYGRKGRGKTQEVDFKDIKWGTFTAGMKRYQKKNPSTPVKTLKQFADLILKNPEDFTDVMRKKAQFYKNIILKGGADSLQKGLATEYRAQLQRSGKQDSEQNDFYGLVVHSGDKNPNQRGANKYADPDNEYDPRVDLEFKKYGKKMAGQAYDEMLEDDGTGQPNLRDYADKAQSKFKAEVRKRNVAKAERMKREKERREKQRKEDLAKLEKLVNKTLPENEKILNAMKHRESDKVIQTKFKYQTPEKQMERIQSQERMVNRIKQEIQDLSQKYGVTIQEEEEEEEEEEEIILEDDDEAAEPKRGKGKGKRGGSKRDTSQLTVPKRIERLLMGKLKSYPEKYPNVPTAKIVVATNIMEKAIKDIEGVSEPYMKHLLGILESIRKERERANEEEANEIPVSSPSQNG